MIHIIDLHPEAQKMLRRFKMPRDIEESGALVALAAALTGVTSARFCQYVNASAQWSRILDARRLIKKIRQSGFDLKEIS